MNCPVCNAPLVCVNVSTLDSYIFDCGSTYLDGLFDGKTMPKFNGTVKCTKALFTKQYGETPHDEHMHKVYSEGTNVVYGKRPDA